MPDSSLDLARRSGAMDTLAIVPSSSRTMVALAPALVLLLLLVVGSAVARPRGSGAMLLVALIVLVLLFPAYFWLWSRNARLFVGHDYFGYTDAFGRRTVFALTDLHRVIDRPVMVFGGSSPIRFVYFVGPGNRVHYRFNAGVWKTKLEEFLELLGSPLERSSVPITASALASELKNAKSA